jgi:excisionase family DNA binding protein
MCDREKLLLLNVLQRRMEHLMSQPAYLKFYTIKQVAEFVEASTRTVRRWIKEGLLVAHRVNGVVRISEADFQKFLADHRGK